MITRTPFGRAGNEDVSLYTLTNVNGLTMTVMTYGAIITSLSVPDRTGTLADIVLGFDDLASYIKNSPYFGATVGRVGNRIRNARFELGDKAYVLAANDKPHHLHGGVKGWDKAVWSAEPAESPDGPALKLAHISMDGDEGYPGTVAAVAIYTLTNNNELRIAMQATSDKTTIVNMVHHTYWNLGGVHTGLRRITDHQLLLHADTYTPGDPMVPTGVEQPVRGTPFDFTAAKAIGQDLEAAGGHPVGFDHNFVVRGNAGQGNGKGNEELRDVARLQDPGSGRVMTLRADQPGVQFYSGNFLDGTLRGKGGATYAQYTGLCLETQKFPNAINVPAWRAQLVLDPGQTYKHTMIHRFTTA